MGDENFGEAGNREFLGSFFFFFFDVNTALLLNFKPKKIHHGLKLTQESKD